MKQHLIITLFLFQFLYGIGQNANTSYNLQECIAIALKNNLDLKLAQLKTKTADVKFKQGKNGLLPTLNGNYNIGKSNGRSIDPFTNSYINEQLTFSNAGLNLDVNVFNGFKVRNEIRQSRFNLQASEMEIEDVKQNLILEVTLLYIQILNTRDLLKLTKATLVSTKSQLKRLESHYKNGIGNPADFTDMKGQYNRDQAGIITAENNLKSSILSLVKVLNLDLDSENEFESILGLIATEKYQFSANEVYSNALENLATFKSKQLRIDAAKTGVKIANSGYFPEVSFFGLLNTNFSNNAQIFTPTGTSIIETGDFISLNNMEHPVLRNEAIYHGTKISYKDQFENNLNSVAGISVRLPLFNGFRTKNNVKIEKLQLEETRVNLKQTKFIFKQSIKEAYNNMASSFERYQILKKQVKAFEESFRINEVRFNSGVSNIVEYITSKNNMDASRLNLNTTKYEYLLRVKILDYYRGI